MEAAIELAAAFPGRPVRAVPGSASAPEDEAGLVAAARTGDERAFERLYRRFAPLVHGLLLARVPPSAVDDLVQEVFLTVFRRLGALREDAAFPGWLCAIARTRAADFHRTELATVELREDLPSPAEPRPALAVLEVIRRLPETYRETLVLRLVEGMTGPEIALRTGLAAGSVRVNLHRGMALLRAALDPAAGPAGGQEFRNG
jgi:RNA polymerase sigma-70 factor (ECF subfamily)